MNEHTNPTEFDKLTNIENINSKELNENLKKINLLTLKISNLLKGKVGYFNSDSSNFNKVTSDIYTKLASKFFSNLLTNPNIIFEAQINYYNSFLKDFFKNQNLFLDVNNSKDLDEKKKYFYNLLLSNYKIVSDLITESINKANDLSQNEKEQFNFFTNQLIQMLSPENFLITNSEALSKAFETKGGSLVNGLENLVNDIEKNNKHFEVSLVNENAFSIGKNIAHTSGSVIFENKLFQLIHYKPVLSRISQTPLLIIPPCINKFYNLDLQEKNSFVKFSLSQGIDVFMISWVNADNTHKNVSFEDYIDLGILTASKVVKRVANSEKINALGYCIGGTMLSVTLSYLIKRKKNFFNSATFLTTLTDFKDIGDLSFFITDDHFDNIKSQVNEYGILKGDMLSKTFNLLKSKDLFFKPAVRSYLIGKKPPAFDILYWNNDKTNLPGKMALEYLDCFYRENLYSNNNFKIFGVDLSLSDIDIPIFVVSTEKDHIAPWKSSFKSLNKTNGDKTFVLAESGHIAGIINPFGSEKYGYKISNNIKNFEKRNCGLDRNPGSWWTEWSQWKKSHSGSLIESIIPGSNKKFPIIEKAPGRYVLKKDYSAVQN